MKTLGQQVLVLGGFYFIISFLSSLGASSKAHPATPALDKTPAVWAATGVNST